MAGIISPHLQAMDNRFQSGQSVQNGGMFTRDKINQITQQLISLYGNNGELRPQDLARCMIDTYRAMNKHYIPNGYELSAFAKVFDHAHKGLITQEDVRDTATRIFLASNTSTTLMR